MHTHDADARITTHTRHTHTHDTRSLTHSRTRTHTHSLAHTHAHTHTHNTTLQVTPNVKPVSDGPLKFDEVMANYDYCMDWVAKMYVLLFFVF